MSISSSAAKGASSTFLSQWMKFIVQIGSLAILSRLLTPSDYGLITMLTAIAGVAYVLADFGFSMASIQSANITSEQKSNLFWLNTLLGVILSAILILSAPLLADFYDRPELTLVAYAMSATIFLFCMSSQFKAECTKSFKFDQIAVVEVVSHVLSFTAAIVAALLQAGYWALVLQQLIASMTLLAGFIIATNWRPGRPRRHQQMGELLRFGGNNLSLQLVNYFSNNSDSITIGKFLDAASLGLYGRAYQIFMMPMQQLAAPMTRVAFPLLSRVLNTDKYWNYVYRAQNGLAYSLCGAFVVAGLMSEPIIEILLGDAWRAAADVLSILAVGGIFQALGYVYYWVFLSQALTGVQLRVGVFSRSVMVVLVVMSVQWGVNGVASAMAVGYIVHWIALTVFAVPKAGVTARFFLSAAKRPVLMWVAIAIIVAPLKFGAINWTSPFWQLATMSTIIGFACLLAYTFVEPIKKDLNQLFAVLTRILRRK